MDLYQMREDLKCRVIEAFVGQEEIYQIRLFGREAEGQSDGYSDIDLIVCSNDPARTQDRYRQVFNSISPVWATFPLVSTAESFSEMILLAGYSPYHKIDFSIGSRGKEDWRSLMAYDSPDKPRTACTRLTPVDIRQDVAYKLLDVLFSVARFTKCLFRDDVDMVRRWQSITNLTLVLLYEKYCGWQPEMLAKRLGAYEFKSLSEHLDPEDREVLYSIYSPDGYLDLARSYRASIDLFIELSRQKADYFGVVLQEELIAAIKQFLDAEINRFQRQRAI